ncbi:DUF6807 family protein [Cyclobacterium roseum]|uniref:DUF6807 family protein n=1 Tax=Cyclobacterium roseum TaxID=2666137 RepID=UPI001F2E10F5|nr:DUF6807 family protein [Cyclobacterium roseum]
MMPAPHLMMPKAILVLLCLLASPCQLTAQQLVFEETEDGWLLTEDGKPRYFYQATEKSLDGLYPRANYVHPLYHTNGEILTEDFPEDHPHHRGIFWTWHQLWVNDQRVADPWVCEGIRWEVKNVKTAVNPNGSATLEAKVIWRGTGTVKKNLLEETVRIDYQRVSSYSYKLSFAIQLKPLVKGLRLGGSEDAKGYGGFSPRVKLTENAAFYDENDAVIPQEIPVTAGAWINLTEGDPEDPGLVIMGEPDKLPSYQGWILRDKNSMQNMAFPGQNPITLDRNAPLVFRNQLLVHQGLKKQEIVDQYRIFRNQ